MNRAPAILLLFFTIACNSSEADRTEETEKKEEPVATVVQTSASAPAMTDTLKENSPYITPAEDTRLYFDAQKSFDTRGRAAIEKMYRQTIPDAGALYQLLRGKMIAQRQKAGFIVSQPHVPAAWAQPCQTSYETAEAEIVYRYGDMDNLGYGWPKTFDPFSGNSTPRHSYPFYPEISDPPGTDRIMVVSGYTYSKQTFAKGNDADGYTKSSERPYNKPVPLTLRYDLKGKKIRQVLLQIFADDFQPLTYQSKYTVSINNKEAVWISDILNGLKQSGPVGKLLSVQVLPEFITEFQKGHITLQIDAAATKGGDGFAIDFIRLLINPKNLPVSSISGKITDAATRKPIEGVMVRVSGAGEVQTGAGGQYQMNHVPCGMIVITATKAGYKSSQHTLDLVADNPAVANLKLEPETNDNLQEQLDQRGKIALYGIYFDSDKAVLKPESESTLKQIVLLLQKNPDLQLEIGGHTDAEGDDTYNLRLSEQRAAAVLQWLKDNNVNTALLSSKGYGETVPVADNQTATGRSLNRRVEIKKLTH